MACPNCNSKLQEEIRDLKNYYQIVYLCTECQYIESLPPIPKSTKITPEEIQEFYSGIRKRPTKRRRGVTAKESRREYLSSPDGKAATARYRKSRLFKEAHARHRKTKRYQETQQRFHDKRRYFDRLLNPHARKFFKEDLMSNIDTTSTTEQTRNNPNYIKPETLTDNEVEWMIDIFKWAWHSGWIESWEPWYSDRETLNELEKNQPGRYLNLCICKKLHHPHKP